MSDQPSKSGIYVSGALHAALLAFIVIGFAAAPKFADAPESIVVDGTIPLKDFNEIMKGERDAKPVEKPPAEPTTRQAAVEPPAIPTPPAPPPEFRTVEEPPAPPPPPKPAPPSKPEPPPRPTAEEAPPPPVKPKPPPPEKPRPDDPAKPHKTYDPNAIAKLIGQNKSAIDPAPAGAATPQGLPDQHAARMSPSLSAALDAWLQDAYLNCWTPPPTMPEGERYVAQVRVEFSADGALARPPELLNPPADPAWRAHAESAMRAALKCNPLHVPPQYAPYFEQWRTKTVHFDPESALG